MGNHLGPRVQAAVLLTLVATLGLLLGIGIGRWTAPAAPPAGVVMPGPPAPDGPGLERQRPPQRQSGPLRVGTGMAREPVAYRPRGGPPPVRRLSDVLEADIGLSARQKAAIDSIVAEERERVRALRSEYEPLFRAIVRDARGRLEEVLTDAQKDRLRELRFRPRGPDRDSIPAT